MGRLGIGFIGSGFMTRFHIKSFIAVRDADVLGVWSPNRSNAEVAAAEIQRKRDRRESGEERGARNINLKARAQRRRRR